MRPVVSALVLIGIGLSFLCFWAPWEQVDPSTPGLTVPLGFAPIWTRQFQYFPGARVDLTTLSIYLAFLCIIATFTGLVRFLRSQ